MTDKLTYVKELLSFDEDYEKDDIDEHIIVNEEEEKRSLKLNYEAKRNNFQYKLKFDLVVLLDFLQKENPNYFSKIKYIDIESNSLEIEDIKNKLKKIEEMIGTNSTAIDLSVFPTFTGKQIYTIIEYLVDKECSLFDIKLGIKEGFYISCDKPICSVLVKYLSCKNKNRFETNIYHKNLSKEKSCYILMKDSFGKDLKVFYLKKKDILTIYRSILKYGK